MELEAVASGAAFFTCTSGEFLWGQLHTVIEGFAAAEAGTALGSDAEGSFRFKVAARKGRWKAESAFLDDWHVGFVCHHVDVEGLEVLRRAAEAGIGGAGKYGALDIVSVGRYDWSGSHSPGCELIVQTVEGKTVDLEEDEFDDEKYYRSLVAGRFMLVDKLGFASLIQALKDGKKLERKNYVLKKEETGSKKDTVEEAFGTHLVVDNSEYDLGWMAFQNGELVGFVYDGAYSGLEGSNLRLGN